MVKKLLIANWKNYKNLREAVDWVKTVGSKLRSNEIYEYIVCPPYPLIESVKRTIDQNGFKLVVGSQTVSNYEEGAFTGEVSVKALEEMVQYALVGHSERRQLFGESNTDVESKVELCNKYLIEPLVLIRNEKDIVPENVKYFAWEPVSAIGTGKAVDASEADKTVAELTKGRSGLYGMYGGSVNPSNIASFMHSPNLYGVVVGSASLDPDKYLEMVNAIC